MRLLAQIGVKLEILDDAEFLLESVLVFAPDYRAARYEYASRARAASQIPAGRSRRQTSSCRRAAQPCLPDPYANACGGLGRHDDALQVYRELLVASPQAADLHLSIAHALKTLGRQPEAIESYRRPPPVRPSYGDAYWSLANLKTYRFTDEELARCAARRPPRRQVS